MNEGKRVITSGLEPLLGVEKRLEHAFVEEHVTHRLRDDDVDHLRQLYFLHLPRYHDDTVEHLVRLYEGLQSESEVRCWCFLDEIVTTDPDTYGQISTEAVINRVHEY